MNRSSLNTSLNRELLAIQQNQPPRLAPGQRGFGLVSHFWRWPTSWAFPPNQNTFRDTYHSAKLFGLKNMGNLDTIHPIQAAQDERLAALKRCESIQHRSPWHSHITITEVDSIGYRSGQGR